MYEQLEKNDVSAKNQLKDNEYVRFYNPEGKGIRVMFAGNSITLHSVKEDIGWFNEWGMAASKKENDYVHLLMTKVSQKDSDAVFCIAQVSAWETDYKNGSQKHSMYEAARNFNADIIIVRFIENCPVREFEPQIHKREYIKMVDYLDGTGKAKIILTTSFWRHPGDASIREFSEERGLPLAELYGESGQSEEMMAIGKFWHEGVSIHPGDKGMEMIANKIWDKMEQFGQI